MGFLPAVYAGFSRWKNYSGRACRSEYWYFILFTVIWLSLVLFIVGAVAPISEGFAILLYFVEYLSIFVPSIALIVRRLHDLNITGWGIVISFVPVLGGLILLVAMCWPGTAGANSYGPPTFPGNTGEKGNAPELEEAQSEGP
jgi:uncharacterized membrane protein YhaH (DUF805 family)